MRAMRVCWFVFFGSLTAVQAIASDSPVCVVSGTYFDDGAAKEVSYEAKKSEREYLGCIAFAKRVREKLKKSGRKISTFYVLDDGHTSFSGAIKNGADVNATSTCELELHAQSGKEDKKESESASADSLGNCVVKAAQLLKDTAANELAPVNGARILSVVFKHLDSSHQVEGVIRLELKSASVVPGQPKDDDMSELSRVDSEAVLKAIAFEGVRSNVRNPAPLSVVK